MKSKLGQITVPSWIAIFIILGLSIWLIKVIRYQVALSSMYIVAKNPCNYDEKKSIIIFLDQRSQKSLRKFQVTATKIAIEANKIFSNHGLPFRYDVNDLKIREWNTANPNCKSLDKLNPDEIMCFINEIRFRYKKERETNNPDILIFVTAAGVSEISGRSFLKFPQGNGTIILNLGNDPHSYDSDEKLSKVARKFFLKRFAQLLIHEQAHLYGVIHSTDTYSIMRAKTDMLGNHQVTFDKISLEVLIKRNSELNKIRKQCAAHL